MQMLFSPYGDLNVKKINSSVSGEYFGFGFEPVSALLGTRNNKDLSNY